MDKRRIPLLFDHGNIMPLHHKKDEVCIHLRLVRVGMPPDPLITNVGFLTNTVEQSRPSMTPPCHMKGQISVLVDGRDLLISQRSLRVATP
jgi:hypothetical protein